MGIGSFCEGGNSPLGSARIPRPRMVFTLLRLPAADLQHAEMLNSGTARDPGPPDGLIVEADVPAWHPRSGSSSGDGMRRFCFVLLWPARPGAVTPRVGMGAVKSVWTWVGIFFGGALRRKGSDQAGFLVIWPGGGRFCRSPRELREPVGLAEHRSCPGWRLSCDVVRSISFYTPGSHSFGPYEIGVCASLFHQKLYHRRPRRRTRIGNLPVPPARAKHTPQAMDLAGGRAYWWVRAGGSPGREGRD